MNPSPSDVAFPAVIDSGDRDRHGEPMLQVADLTVTIGRRHPLPVIETAALAIDRQQSLGIVGESGSGKSMLCRALIGMLGRYDARVTGGSIRFEGTELAGAGESTWRRIRGKEIGYVPQSSLAGLNPVLTVGTQMIEAVTADTDLRGATAKQAAIEYLELVHLPDAARVMRKRSGELSGGMRQRVIIAAALARKPRLLIADEPTTALDVSVQSEILAMLAELRAELGMALILISHDIAVIEEVCDRVIVMYAGATVEESATDVVMQQPLHPYTEALLDARIDAAARGRDVPTISGEPPLAGAWPPGCRFWPRCPEAEEICRQGDQPTTMPFGDRASACIFTERRLHHGDH